MSFRLPRTRLLLRSISAAGVVMIAVYASGDSADAGVRGRAPWCGNLSGHGLDDCNYLTFEQCVMSVHGLGGICARNPAAAYDPEMRRPRKVRRAFR